MIACTGMRFVAEFANGSLTFTFGNLKRGASMHEPESSISEAVFFGERFLTPGDRSAATHDLVSLGSRAVPILISLANGRAVNRHGISYQRLGVMDCVLVTIKHLGNVADATAPMVREAMAAQHPYAIPALAALTPTDDNIRCLADALNCGETHIAYDAAAAIHRLEVTQHSAVTGICDHSTYAQSILDSVKGA